MFVPQHADAAFAGDGNVDAVIGCSLTMKRVPSTSTATRRFDAVKSLRIFGDLERCRAAQSNQHFVRPGGDEFQMALLIENPRQ